jgi:hypothetical protein
MWIVLAVVAVAIIAAVVFGVDRSDTLVDRNRVPATTTGTAPSSAGSAETGKDTGTAAGGTVPAEPAAPMPGGGKATTAP